MATIGEDLMTILGIIPTRDRAGIQRGTMADEAARSSQAAQAATAPAYSASAPMQMPAAPPKFEVPPEMRGPGGDLQLPAEVPTEYASGRAPSPKAPIPTLPPGQERVVTSSPAAAPSPGVQKQASDVLLAAMEQRQRQQKMMQIIGHLGMMANAFNRNPDSQAATRASLSGMISGGGGGGGAGLGDLKTVLDMREKEAAAAQATRNSETQINHLMTVNGWSRAQAEAVVTAGKAGDYLDPKTVKQREEDSRAAQIRTDLDKPEVIEEVAKRTGVPAWQVQAWNRNGELLKHIDPKELAEIRDKHSQTNERIAKTDEETRSTEQKWKADTAYTYYKDNPEAFARLHGLKDADEARRIVDDRKAYDKYQETSGPSAYAGTAAYHSYERAERAAGRMPLSQLEFDKEKAKAGVAQPEDIITTASVKAAQEQMHKSQEEARQAAQNVKDRHMLQEQWRPDLIAGGKLAEKQTELRSTVAQLFNMPDEQASDTKVFFSTLNKNVQAAAKSLPGAFSNNDLLFMKELEGGQTLDAIGIRKLQIIHEKMELAKLAKHDRYFESQTAKQGLTKLKNFYDKSEVIEPGRFIRENMKANPQDVEALLKNPTPAEKKMFDREYGYGRADWIIARGGKIDD